MEGLYAQYDLCAASPAYIHLPQDTATLSALMGRLGPSLELEELVNAHSAAATLEGFINGWAWAQGTARECIELRRLPEIEASYDPGEYCGTCIHFVQHYRYTGSPPWYALVGCGHCMCPETRKDQINRYPLWRGCRHWKGRG